MGTLNDLIDRNENIEDIGDYLDKLSHESRLTEIRQLTGRHQKRLYEMATPTVKKSDLIPDDFPNETSVIFYGQNSLPILNQFQKRMFKNEDGTLTGYNHQSLQPLSGPGYFVVTNETDRPGEALLDYTQKPSKTIPSWPAIKSNTSGISRFIYGHMKDYMRRVSEDVTIGIATKKEKEIGQYFVLCREPLDSLLHGLG